LVKSIFSLYLRNFTFELKNKPIFISSFRHIDLSILLIVQLKTFQKNSDKNVLI